MRRIAVAFTQESGHKAVLAFGATLENSNNNPATSALLVYLRNDKAKGIICVFGYTQ